MRIIGYSFILLFLHMIAGCTWQKIPPSPEYVKTPSLPFRVGVIAAPDSNSTLFVPAVVSELRNMRLFDSILYPYHEGDPVDATATLSVDGDWKPSGIGPKLAVGLTFGLASPFVGPSVTGTHIIKAAMITDKEDLGFYSAKVSTTAKWGFLADGNEAKQKTQALQIKRLADALAKAIREDQNNLLAKVKTGGHENPLASARTPRKTKRIASEIPQAIAPPLPRPTLAAQNPQALKQGLFSFEAEKLAIQQSCTTPNGIRPVAYLVKDSNNEETYTVACQQGTMAVRCVFQNCELEQ